MSPKKLGLKHVRWWRNTRCLCFLTVWRTGYSGMIPVFFLMSSCGHFLKNYWNLWLFIAETLKTETFRCPNSPCRTTVPFYPKNNKTGLFKVNYYDLPCPVLIAHFSPVWPRFHVRVPLACRSHVMYCNPSFFPERFHFWWVVPKFCDPCDLCPIFCLTRTTVFHRFHMVSCQGLTVLENCTYDTLGWCRLHGTPWEPIHECVLRHIIDFQTLSDVPAKGASSHRGVCVVLWLEICDKSSRSYDLKKHLYVCGM